MTPSPNLPKLLLVTRLLTKIVRKQNKSSRGAPPMLKDGLNRRLFLKSMSSTGMLAALPEAAFGLAAGNGPVLHEVAAPSQDAAAQPKYSIKFSVCGMSHDHIYGMIGAIQRGGGTLVSAWGGAEDTITAFKKRFPDVKIVATQDGI